MCRPDDFPPYDLDAMARKVAEGRLLDRLDGPNRLTRDVQYAADHVEGVSVFVVTDDEYAAIAVGPDLARVLYPDDTFGQVLHHERAEQATVNGFEVVVRVIRGGTR